jgi:hypothetical protein
MSFINGNSHLNSKSKTADKVKERGHPAGTNFSKSEKYA